MKEGERKFRSNYFTSFSVIGVRSSLNLKSMRASVAAWSNLQIVQEMLAQMTSQAARPGDNAAACCTNPEELGA